MEADLARAKAELKAFMATWEYAFSMAGGCHGGRDHPVHWATQARAEELAARCRALRARLAERRIQTSLHYPPIVGRAARSRQSR